MRRIGETFRRLDGEGALVTYVMGGDPDIPTTERILDAVVKGGADIIELGIPFSDPIADGRSIQAAGVRSLKSGTRPADVLGVASRLKERHNIPVAVMTYYNVLFSPGLENFLEGARRSGVDGLIVPDLPLDETADYCRMASARGIDPILLAAPTTPASRMRSLVRHSSGFLYLVSLLGVTGARSTVGEETIELIGAAKRQTRGKIPLGVGFGISKPEHVRGVLQAGADAAIVGSSLVDRIASGKTKAEMLQDVEGYVRSLKLATKPRAPGLT